MWLPNLTQQYTQSLFTTQFLGLNKNLVTSDGEFASEMNLTTDYFPVMAPRKPRKFPYTLSGQTHVSKKAELGLLAKDTLCRLTNTGTALIPNIKLYINDLEISGLTFQSNLNHRQLVSMGAYLIIWPDKLYVNTKDTTDVGSLGQSNTLANQQLTVTMTRLDPDGTYEDFPVDQGDNTKYATDASDTAPDSPVNGQEWIDTSSDPATLKRWNAGTSEWVQVATTYVRISGPGSSNIGKGFKDYDTVTVSGLVSSNATDNALLEQFNTDLIVYKAVSDDSFIVAGIISKPITVSSTDVTAFKAERRIPDCDYITEANNRLWGCKYGLVNGKPVNEIYACKLGDPKNWYSYMGLSTDSYAVTVGSDGAFTGAATLKGYPLFFKETCLHRIAGNFPSNFTLTTTQCRGVQKYSDRSLAVVGERLFYKSRTDVMVYDGSVPQPVSEALGKDMTYGKAIAGSYGSKYYISMCEYSLDINRKLYVFDTSKGIWHMENDPGIISFAQLDDELYAAYRNNTQNGIVALNGTDGDDETDPVEWNGTFGIFGYEYEDQKYLSRFNLRMRLEFGTKIQMYIQYDSDGEWHHCGEITGQTTDTITVPIAPRRCDHCQIALVGEGPAKIFSIGRVLEGGSDGHAVYV